MPDALTPTWAALSRLTDNLMSLRGQLAELQMAERSQRVQTYAMSEETSVSGRERQSDVVVLELSRDIINLKAEIASKEDMRQLLVLAIEHGVEVV